MIQCKLVLVTKFLVAASFLWSFGQGFSTFLPSVTRTATRRKPSWHESTRHTRATARFAVTTKLLPEISAENPEDSSRHVTTSRGQVNAEEWEHVPTTFAEAFRVFLLGSYQGPRMVVLLLVGIATWRLQLVESPLSVMDATTMLGMVLFWCFQEHFLHGHVLHSNLDWLGKEIHEQHHAKPYHHVSIDPAWLMLTWMGVVHVIFLYILPLPLALSATLGYALSGLWYEFLHFIVHTRLRFRKGSYLQTMKDHHARHHLIDHRYWLGFSLPVVDDLFGTNPSVTQVRRWKRDEAS